MKYVILRLSIFFFVSFFINYSIGQSYKPFWDEIKAFKKSDSLNKPAAHPIVFVGSSSFRKWTNVNEAFPGYPIINRGFGGSTFPDVILYLNEIVFPYHPSQVVIYCGDNDLASSDTMSAQIVAKRFEDLFKQLRRKLPNSNIVFVSIKPSPSRRKLMPAMESTNTLIKKFLSQKVNTAYADVYHPMLDKKGEPLPYIFESDSLHMNSKGYDIWKRVLKPYLKKN